MSNQERAMIPSEENPSAPEELVPALPMGQVRRELQRHNLTLARIITVIDEALNSQTFRGQANHPIRLQAARFLAELIITDSRNRVVQNLPHTTVQNIFQLVQQGARDRKPAIDVKPG